MKEFEISKCFLVDYTSSSAKNGLSHKNTFRNKYIGIRGIIYIIKNKNKQYFQWHPVSKNNEILYTKGLVSSNDDCQIINNILTIVTENSIYNFTIIENLNNDILPPIIW